MGTGGKFDSAQMEKKLYSAVYPPNNAETVVWVGGNFPALI